VAQVIRGAHVVVAAIGDRGAIVVRAIVVIVIRRDCCRRFGHGAAGPPATHGAKDAADHRADRSGNGADRGAGRDAGDAAGRFTHVIRQAGVVVVLSKSLILRALELSIRRVWQIVPMHCVVLG
jgi:hypothetical protein